MKPAAPTTFLTAPQSLGEGLTLTQFADPNSDEAKAWAKAMSMGFNANEPSEEALAQLQRWMETARILATQVSAEDDRTGLPVATFGRFWAPANLGARTVQAAMITAVIVRTAFKRRGILRAMTELNLAQAGQAGAPLALLTASNAEIYGRFGFQPVVPEAAVEVNPGKFALKESATKQIAGYHVDWVLRETLLEQAQELSHLAHPGQRGSTLRNPGFPLEHFYDEESGKIDAKLRGIVCYSPTGQACGYAIYTVADGDPVLWVKDMDFLEPRAEIALWDHLARVEGIKTIKLDTFSLESPLRLCLKDLRAVDIKSVFDLLWARVLDPVQCLEARSYSFAAHAAGLRACFRVEDPLGYAAGSLQVTLSSGGATVERLEDDADVEAVLSVNALAELVYASSSVSNLEVAGLITGLSPKARPRWESLFAPASPATFKNHF